MLEGRQYGYLWTEPGVNGIYIEITDGGYGVDFQRIVNGQRDPYVGMAILRDVYDTRQGTMVPGIELTDVTGNPTGERYKLSDFEIYGNLRYTNDYGF